MISSGQRKPTIHMIHGFVGAGKTTFAKKLEREVQAVRFTPDEWMCDLYGTNPPVEMFSVYDANIRKVMRETCRRIIATGGDVILDEGFWSRADRDETRLWAQSLGADVRLYILECPDGLLSARVLERTKEMPYGALMIDENALLEFRARFEPVDPSLEPGIIIKTG